MSPTLSTAAMGLPADTTVRQLLPMEGGALLGTDKGLAWVHEHGAGSIALPPGLRGPDRLVQVLVAHEGVAHGSTPHHRFTWSPVDDAAVFSPLPRLSDGGHEALWSMLSTPRGLVEGWKERCVGADGPAGLLCLAKDDDGALYGGTVDGWVHALGGWSERIGQGPVRHLTWAHGALWASCDDSMHRWDGEWSSSPDGPTAMTNAPDGTLWALRSGRAVVAHEPRGAPESWTQPAGPAVARPWCLAVTKSTLYLGGLGQLHRFPLEEESSPTLPPVVEVVIEVPRGSFIKRGATGGLEFISPVPCPFNYGSIQGIDGADGDPMDAVVLGPRLRAGARVTVRTWAVAEFTDAGVDDPKIITSHQAPTDEERALIDRFFTRYARIKRVAGRMRGKSGASRYGGYRSFDQ